jgi:hypothetical protein
VKVKVYIVLEHMPYEGDTIKLVTSDKQLAQSRRDAWQEQDSYMGYEVEEYAIDVPSESKD